MDIKWANEYEKVLAKRPQDPDWEYKDPPTKVFIKFP